MPDQLTRRGFVLGAASLLVAAPAVVRASSLMPISPTETLEPICSTYLTADNLESHRFMARELAPWISKWEEQTW